MRPVSSPEKGAVRRGLARMDELSSGTGCRVLMLLENNPYPGDLRVRREAVALVHAGFQVTVICPGKKGSPRTETLNGVVVYRFRRPPGGDGFFGYAWEWGWSLIATFFLAWWVFFRRGFDVIHAHNPPDLFVFVAAAFVVFGKKFVFDHHDLAPDMYRARFTNGGNVHVYRALVFFERLSCRFAHHVIATNESYRQVEMTRGKVPSHRITVVRNGPEDNWLKPVRPDARLRRMSATILGYVGVMGSQDGVDYLLRALAHIVHEAGRRDVFCVLIGGGDAWDDMRSLAEQLDLTAHTEFMGWVQHEKVSRYLSAADICVDPDPSNSFNDRSTMIKMMEYMALAKPIVAFDLTEHRATACDAALYARRNDECDFAEKIMTLMDDAALRRALGSMGRERVENQLAWKLQKENLFKVYEALGWNVDRGDAPSHISREPVLAARQ